MLMTRPKFIENKDWFYIDKTEKEYKLYENACYKLTDKAPKEAVESYLTYNEAIFKYSLGYVPEYVYEEYRKHIARFN